MSGPRPGDAPEDAFAGESVQWRELPALDGLELSLSDSLSALDWQPELDSALESIDARLPVKRRRATDPPGTSFPRPELSGLTFTPEVLDALAARVAEKLRTLPPVLPPPVPPAPRPAVREQRRMKSGTIISIRFRWPLFSFGTFRVVRRVRARA